MNKLKKYHIITKTAFQIFLIGMEILIIAGGLTWLSTIIWKVDSGLEVLERFGLFYGLYQILTYVILSTINDIQADQYLTLRTHASLALNVCAYKNKMEQLELFRKIDKELENDVLNGIKVRNDYILLKKLIAENDTHRIEQMVILVDHDYESSRLQWKFSFLLRLFK